LALLPTFGCSKSRHTADEKYYLVASNIKLPYWQMALKGLERASSDLKVQVDMVGPETYDANEQREEFRRTVSKKPAGILVSAADPALMKSEIDAAVNAGIPVLTMDSDAPESRRLFFIGTNNYQAGLTGGRLLVKKLGGKGNVVVFTIPAQTNLIERLRGYQDAIADSQIKIVQTVDIHGNAATAFDSAMEILDKSKLSVDGFVCLEATAGKEVAEVLNRHNMQGKTVIAMDTDDSTLGWVEKGVIAATIGQKPFTMAYFGVRMLDDLHHNKPQPLSADWAQNLQALVPSVVDTGATLIDSSNVQSIRQTAAEK
jgi:ribose transport system substrate-binding protein